MSLEICQYHGSIRTSYFQAEVKNGSVFAIKKEQDLTEIAKKFLISQENQAHVKSRNDLKDRNIFLIYNVLYGGGADYFIKNINLSPSEMRVKIVSMSCPGMGGPCDMNAEFFIVSAPKTYEKENFKVSFEKLDIFSEPEFEGYEIWGIDKQIEKAFSTLGDDIQSFIGQAHFHNESVESFSEESWYKSLNDNQKETIKQFREALDSRDKKYEELGEEQQNEKFQQKEQDCFQRYHKLCSRLAKPVIN